MDQSTQVDKKLFLLDAFALIYRAYFAFSKNPRVNSKGQNTSAAFGFTNVLIDVIKNENHIARSANVKIHFNKVHGALGNSGSVSFQFKKMGVFKLKPEGVNIDDLELELIDFGLEELGESNDDNGNPIIVLRCAFVDFGNLQKALEDKNLNPISAELEWIPTTTVPVTDEQAEEVSKLIEKLEQDEDVQKVYHNLK